MPIYLIRHTAPAVEKGICYGQSDIDVLETFEDEASVISQHIPGNLQHIYTSPLQRCRKLADRLFPATNIIDEPGLKEINCGEWELQHWDAIPKAVIDPWMNDFVNIAIPGGESYIEMHARVTGCFEQITTNHTTAAIVTHGGVIRSILAHITQTPLKDSFGAFSIHYGCVFQLDKVNEKFAWESLSNIPTPKEQHKPSR
ncbi:MAG: alpha-ribazole phosphatase [Chitinophagaceae bacterium]